MKIKKSNLRKLIINFLNESKEEEIFFIEKICDEELKIEFTKWEYKLDEKESYNSTLGKFVRYGSMNVEMKCNLFSNDEEEVIHEIKVGNLVKDDEFKEDYKNPNGKLAKFIYNILFDAYNRFKTKICSENNIKNLKKDKGNRHSAQEELRRFLSQPIDFEFSTELFGVSGGGYTIRYLSSHSEAAKSDYDNATIRIQIKSDRIKTAFKNPATINAISKTLYHEIDHAFRRYHDVATSATIENIIINDSTEALNEFYTRFFGKMNDDPNFSLRVGYDEKGKPFYLNLGDETIFDHFTKDVNIEEFPGLPKDDQTKEKYQENYEYEIKNTFNDLKEIGHPIVKGLELDMLLNDIIPVLLNLWRNDEKSDFKAYLKAKEPGEINLDYKHPTTGNTIRLEPYERQFLFAGLEYSRLRMKIRDIFKSTRGYANELKIMLHPGNIEHVTDYNHKQMMVLDVLKPLASKKFKKEFGSINDYTDKDLEKGYKVIFKKILNFEYDKGLYMNFDLARAIAGLYKHRDKNSELLAQTLSKV